MRSLTKLTLIFGFPLVANLNAQVVMAGMIDKENLEREVNKNSFNEKTFIERVRKVKDEQREYSVECTLEGCIELAIKNNPALKRSSEEIKAQESAVLAAKLQWLPSFSLIGQPGIGNSWNTASTFPYTQGVEILQDRYPAVGAPLDNAPLAQNLFSNYQSSSINANLAWTFFDYSRSKNIESQEDLLRKSKLAYNITVRNLIQAVQSKYAEIESNLLALEKYKDIIRTSDKALSMLQSQYEAKYVGLADISNARTQNLNLKSSYLNLLNDLESNTAALAALVGIDDLITLSPDSISTTVKPWQMDIDETLQISKRNNEEYKALVAESESLQARSKSLSYNSLPKLFAGLRGAYQYSNGIIGAPRNTEWNDYYNINNSNWTASAGLGFSIKFDGGQSIARGQQLSSQSKAIQFQAVESQINTTYRIKSSYESLSNNRVRVEASTQAVKEAENVALVIKTVAALGIADVTQQVQAITLYESAVISFANAVFASKLALIHLYRYTFTLPENVQVISTLFDFK